MFKSITKKHQTTVEEIHETFFTEVDRLLSEAKIPHSLESSMDDMIAKSERLVALGFHKSKDVKAVTEEKKRLEELKSENEKKSKLVSAIEYFSTRYPPYKFITEESVKKICEKYGLVYGGVSDYIGEIPENNITQMEAFKISDDDKLCFCSVRFLLGSIPESISYFSYSDYKKYLEERKNHPPQTYLTMEMVNRGVSPLEIAAPPSDFNLTGKKIKDFKVTNKPVPDPVVLQPVFYQGNKYYLIVTAWGQEASDELVVNEKSN